MTTTVTTPVSSAPTPFMTARRHQPGVRSLNQRTTMPDCDRVKLVNTPTA